MLRNIFRQSFVAVFIPLLLVAGLFWLNEWRGYQSEVALLALARSAAANGAANNLVALAQSASFVAAVFATDEAIENSLLDQTPAERQALWRRTVSVKTVAGSDLIRITAAADTPEASLQLVRGVILELVRTGSRFYNQKTDLDIRIIEEPTTAPKLTAWLPFVLSTVGTALFFTVLFFMIYNLLGRVFPKARTYASSQSGEYVISPDTFKPRVPAYWGREENTHLLEKESRDTAAAVSDPVLPQAEPADEEVPETAVYVRASIETSDEARITPMLETFVADPLQQFESAETIETAGVSRGYAAYAAAPDNLPIVESPSIQFQGVQPRPLPTDMDVAVESELAESRETSASIDVEEVRSMAQPETHEPTPEEYKRRLNELLSGKM